MTTLADMTPEQRAECVGMWCYIFEQLDEPPVEEGIIAGYREDDDRRTLVIIDHPHPDAGKWGHELNEVSPRFDLPRAWQPDGQPVPGEWEHAELRKRIEERIRELKQPLCSHMPEGDELDDYLEQWDRQSYEAEILTRILEGDPGA